MSGPLASWVQAHSAATATARYVLVTLALRADPDGAGADLSVGQLVELTGLAERSVRRGLTEVLERKELRRLRRGNGRGQISWHRIPIRWCDSGDTGDSCISCTALRKAVDNFKAATPRKAATVTTFQRKGATQAGKVVTESVKVVTVAAPTLNGDGPPSGGTVTHPESAAAPAPDGAAADGGLSETNRAALTEFYAEQRRLKTAKATAPTTPECDPDPRAVCDPPDVANPAPPRAGTPHQDVAREPIDRRRRTARRGRRGREPPATCTRSRPTSRSPPWPTTSGTDRSPVVLDVCSASRTSCQPTNMAIRRKHAAPHSRSSRPCEPEGTDPEAVSPLRRPRQGDPMPPDLPSDQGAPHVRTPTG